MHCCLIGLNAAALMTELLLIFGDFKFSFFFLSQIIGLKVFAINGNHDIGGVFGRKSVLNMLEESLGKFDINPLIGTRWDRMPKTKVYSNEKINIIGIDYIREKDFLRELSRIAELIDPDKKNFLVMHQNLKPFYDEGVPLEEIKKHGFDFIINGHLHNSQYESKEGVLIVGSSSLTRFSPQEFTEKYVWIWDNGRIVQKKVPNIRTGKVVKLDLRGKNPKEIYDALKDLDTGEILYVYLKLDERIDLSNFIKDNIHFKIEVEKEKRTFEVEKGGMIVMDAVERAKSLLKDKTSIDVEKYFSLLEEEVPPNTILTQLLK